MILVKIYVIVLILLLFYLTRGIAKKLYMEECNSIEYYKKYNKEYYDYKKDYARNIIPIIFWPITFIYIVFVTINKYYFNFKHNKYE